MIIIKALMSIIILAITQVLSITVFGIAAEFGLPVPIGNMGASILYIFLAYFAVKWWCSKILHFSLEDCRITKFSLKPIWCIAAIIMPCLVSGVLVMTSGHWQNTAMDSLEMWELITAGIFFYGIAAGIVEEMVFRGVIMHALEYRWNKQAAVIIPSVLFGLLHIEPQLNFMSIIQLVIAGSAVGILFSLVTYESGTIWNSAVMHGIWNVVIIGNILHIGIEADEFSIYNYILDTDSFFISGGGFGIEASIVSIIAYLIFTGLAIILLKKRKSKPAASTPSG